MKIAFFLVFCLFVTFSEALSEQSAENLSLEIEQQNQIANEHVERSVRSAGKKKGGRGNRKANRRNKKDKKDRKLKQSARRGMKKTKQ